MHNIFIDETTSLKLAKNLIFRKKFKWRTFLYILEGPSMIQIYFKK